MLYVIFHIDTSEFNIYYNNSEDLNEVYKIHSRSVFWLMSLALNLWLNDLLRGKVIEQRNGLFEVWNAFITVFSMTCFLSIWTWFTDFIGRIIMLKIPATVVFKFLYMREVFNVIFGLWPLHILAYNSNENTYIVIVNEYTWSFKNISFYQLVFTCMCFFT